MFSLHLFIIERLSKIYLNISFDDTNLISRLAFDYIYQVVLPTVMYVNGVALTQTGVIGELIL